MPFLFIRNDITKVHADAIVNPSNSELLPGDGTSRAIYLAAGEEKLREACEKIGYCGQGEAVITEGFGLPAKYIIHTAGPAWQGGACGEIETLYCTYMEILKLAKQYDLESVAFPLISSGNYGFPKEVALKTAISAISGFLMENDLLVYMVLYDRKSVMVSQKLFNSIEEYIDDHYVDEKYTVYCDGDTERKRQFPKRGFRELFGRKNKQRQIVNEEMAAPSVSVPGMAAQPMQKPEKRRKLEDIMKHMGETFSQMLLRLIDEKGYTDAQVYHKANIDRRHFSKIRNNKDYVPNKKTVMAFTVALELSLDEAADLLRSAGFTFSASSKFDVIISFFLENGTYDVFEINEVLFTYGQPLIGG